MKLQAKMQSVPILLTQTIGCLRSLFMLHKIIGNNATNTGKKGINYHSENFLEVCEIVNLHSWVSEIYYIDKKFRTSIFFLRRNIYL